MEIIPAAILLFLIMDPVGNIPIFLSLLKKLPEHRRRVVLARELLIALAVLLFFLYTGDRLLALLHVRQESVSIAGGIVLFIIGIRMIFPPAEGLFGDIPEGEPFIVPLAIPCIAGPSTIAALMLLGNQHPGRNLDWTIAVIAAWLASAAILVAATTLYRWLGVRALAALERLMGMLLVAISVQMFLDGVRAYLAA